MNLTEWTITAVGEQWDIARLIHSQCHKVDANARVSSIEPDVVHARHRPLTTRFDEIVTTCLHR